MLLKTLTVLLVLGFFVVLFVDLAIANGDRDRTQDQVKQQLCGPDKDQDQDQTQDRLKDCDTCDTCNVGDCDGDQTRTRLRTCQ